MLEKMNIVHQEEIVPRIFSYGFTRGEMVSQMKAGQFLYIFESQMIQAHGDLFQSPREIDKERKICRIIYRIEGQATEIFSEIAGGFSVGCHGSLKEMGLIYLVWDIEDTALNHRRRYYVPPLLQVTKELHSKGSRSLRFLDLQQKPPLFWKKR